MLNINHSISKQQYSNMWRQTQRTASNTNAFGGMLARASGAAQVMTDHSKCYPNFSPSVQLHIDYEEWLAGRPSLSLPDSAGLTEANLACLRERYSGSLSEFERMEALQALRDLGVFSREVYNSAMGFGGVRRAAMNETYNSKSQGYIGGASGDIRQGPLGCFDNEWQQQWENIHVNSPFAKLETLDEILAWTRRVNIAGLAEKYDPHHMTQEQYNAFLDELEQKGILSNSGKMLVKNPDMRFGAVDWEVFAATGGKLFGGGMVILGETFSTKVPSLEEMGGDAVRLVKAMLESEMDQGAMTNGDRQRIEALKTVSEILGQM
ncbi:MAG: hypothetical protein K2O18_06740 [Oscillospiraceae bacterium]|nr:hypothetical protein [Oscillospiraceae bacterium]